MSQDNGESPARRPGRPQNPVDPASSPRALLAQELRDLRKACGVPTLRVLETYAGTGHRRLGEAARDCDLPSWPIVESYIQGCWDYFEAQQHHPPSGAGNLELWKQRYRQAGGSLPEQPPEDPPLENQPARQASGRRPGRLLVAAAAAVALLVSGVLACVYAVGSGRSSGGHRDRISVASPTSACGSPAQDELRSPAATGFGRTASVVSVHLDGISAAVIEGTYQGTAYAWLESRPDGHRAGVQLRWAATRGGWHYCTATDEGGPVAGLPGLVATVAVPATLHGEQITFQACIWHQHPFTSRCSSLRTLD
jgi:hypothetical protein